MASDNMWGSTDLQIVVGSVVAGTPPAPLTKSKLLPNPADLSAKTVVVQQQGRDLGTVKARLCVDTNTKYRAFGTDNVNGTSATLKIQVAGINGTYMVESVGEPEYVRHDMIFFDVTWLEV